MTTKKKTGKPKTQTRAQAMKEYTARQTAHQVALHKRVVPQRKPRSK